MPSGRGSKGPRECEVTNGSLELYDLTSDPHEKNNLAADRPGDVRRLQERIDAWWPVE